MAFIEAGRALRWEEQFEQLCQRHGEERILQVVGRNNDVPRMLGRLLDQLKQSTRDIAVDYAELRRSKVEIETKDVVLQLAARVRGVRAIPQTRRMACRSNGWHGCPTSKKQSGPRWVA